VGVSVKKAFGMRLESFDRATMTVRVACDDQPDWELLDRLSSLITVSLDCGFERILFQPPRHLPVPLRFALEQLASRNGVVLGLDDNGREEVEDEFGFAVLGREPGFICLRDCREEARYVLYLEAADENVDIGARLSYLFASVLGFTSLISFEVRFSVYELLSNIFEHNLGTPSKQWVELDIERAAEKLTVTLVDRGAPFDPTGEEQFDLERYLRSGKRRGLGLIMTRKITGGMRYERESGLNRTSFVKSNAERPGREIRGFKEGTMSQFAVGEPEETRDGWRRIVLEGDLDTKGALVMEDLMNRLIEQRIFRIMIDFEKVPFVSSAGVGILLGLVSSLREEHGEVALLNVSPKVRSIFRLLNLDDYFTIVDSNEQVAGT
jgi:anti-sigma B factor antagonist